MSTYKLMYFNAKGAAEPSRMLFAVAGVEYEDFRFERDQWPEIKPTTPFGQAPVLILDGSTQICQSRSIARFLARRFGLAGDNDIQQARGEMIMESVTDMLQPLLSLFSETDEDKKKEKIRNFEEELLPTFMENFETILKENHGGDGYFVCEKMTVADISFFCCLDWFPAFGIQLDMNKYPKLKALCSKVETHPKIAEWIEKRPKTER